MNQLEEQLKSTLQGKESTFRAGERNHHQEILRELEKCIKNYENPEVGVSGAPAQELKKINHYKAMALRHFGIDIRKRFE